VVVFFVYVLVGVVFLAVIELLLNFEVGVRELTLDPLALDVFGVVELKDIFEEEVDGPVSLDLGTVAVGLAAEVGVVLSGPFDNDKELAVFVELFVDLGVLLREFDLSAPTMEWSPSLFLLLPLEELFVLS